MISNLIKDYSDIMSSYKMKIKGWIKSMGNTKKLDYKTLVSYSKKLLNDNGINGELSNSDMENITSSLKYELLKFEPDDNSRHVLGAIFYKENKIFLNTSLDKKQQLFTLSHEVCHAVLHGDENLPDHIDYSIKNREYSSRESEANMMAYELLMPKDLFLKKYKIYEGAIDKISDLFCVSTDRVIKRLAFLDRKNLLH